MISRRNLLGGLLALGVAPAIVRASSLMKVVPVHPKLYPMEIGHWFGIRFIEDVYVPPPNTVTVAWDEADYLTPEQARVVEDLMRQEDALWLKQARQLTKGGAIRLDSSLKGAACIQKNF